MMGAKLSNMDLPKNKPMVYCSKCGNWVPEITKHNKKIHLKRLGI